MKNIYYYESCLGKLGIAEKEGKITNLIFPNEELKEVCVLKETNILKEAASQLDEYFQGKRKKFNLDLNPQGTEFMKKVWLELQNIPYGETATYKNITQSIGNEKACRAVGMANNKNPIPIFIPCHRVIGANGKLVGYSGGLEIKISLIDLERRNIARK